MIRTPEKLKGCGDREILDTLGGIPLFAGIHQKHLDDMARCTRRIELARGQTIFRVGDPARDLFFLISGQAKRATLSAGGNEKVLELLMPGQCFGTAELFTAHAYVSFAVTVEPSVLLCVGGDSVRRTLGAEPQLSLRIIASLAQRAIATESDAASSHFRTGCQRVLDYLLAQIGSPLPPDGQTTLALTSSKQLIASRIGLTPETLSRVLRDLSDAGMIVVDGRHIHLQNARLARRLAEVNPEQPVFPRKNSQQRHGTLGTPGLQRKSRIAGGTPSLYTAINMAGRQRMLSQRMAKSWLLLGRGVQPGRSRTILEQSTGLFESQMAALATLPLSDEVRASHVEVSDAWQSYRALLNSAPSPAAARRLFELNETVLSAAHRMTQAYEKAAATEQGHLVNLAGRQRMLSQRMVKFYLFQQWGIRMAASQQGLFEATRDFIAALTELANAAHGLPEIEAQLELVSQHWQLLHAALTSAVPADDQRKAALVSNASERLLRQMESTVTLYETLTH